MTKLKPIVRRPKAAQDVESHVFYIEQEATIEVVRVLRGGQNMDSELEKT